MKCSWVGTRGQGGLALPTFISFLPLCTKVIDKETGALYLMRCTQSISLSHSSVNELCLLSQALLEVVAKKINAHVQQNIRDHSIEVSDSFKEDIGNACNPKNIFDGLQNKYNRERFNNNTRTTHLF